MNKKININKIMYYSKGQQFEKPMSREFNIQNGVINLIKEYDKGDLEPIYTVFKRDAIQVNDFQSDVVNDIWKPSVEFMNIVNVKYTETFEKKFLNNEITTDTKDVKFIIINLTKTIK